MSDKLLSQNVMLDLLQWSAVGITSSIQAGTLVSIL